MAILNLWMMLLIVILSLVKSSVTITDMIKPHADLKLAPRAIMHTNSLIAGVKLKAHDNFTRELSEVLYPYLSANLCKHITCDIGHAYYDPSFEKCLCPWAHATVMSETFLWPDQKCDEVLDCSHPFNPVHDSIARECVCSINSLPPEGYDPQTAHEPAGTFKQLETYRRIWNFIGLPTKRVSQSRRYRVAEQMGGSQNHRRQQPPPSGAVSQTPIPSYVPPPPIEVTQELLQQSMAIQPQKIAVIGSVIPHFAAGVMTFYIQLEGPIAQTLVINATDTLPCDTIGGQPSPNIILVPQTVRNRTPEVTIPTCLVLAVNIYDPLWITYWIQKEDGSIFSLLSDNKVHDIDQLNLSFPAALAIRVTPSDGSTKRAIIDLVPTFPEKRHQLYQVPCDGFCPNSYMQMISHGRSGICGCSFNGEVNESDILSRAVEEPNAYTATMTAEACAGMTCINNGNRPAIFNPFSRTCWCAAPTFVEINPSADDKGI